MENTENNIDELLSFKDDVLVFTKDKDGCTRVKHYTNKAFFEWYLQVELEADNSLYDMDGDNILHKLEKFLGQEFKRLQIYSVEELEEDETLVECLRYSAERFGVEEELESELAKGKVRIDL